MPVEPTVFKFCPHCVGVRPLGHECVLPEIPEAPTVEENEAFWKRQDISQPQFVAFRALMDLPDDEARLKVLMLFCEGCGTSTLDKKCWCRRDD